MSSATAIGIDLGGTNIKGVLLDETGHILYQSSRSTLSEATSGDTLPLPWKQAVSAMVHKLKTESHLPVTTIGLAAPGLPNDTNTAIRVMPGRLDSLEGLVWADFLREKCVWVLNDAHAALMAEAAFGAGKNIRNMIMLTLGTGVGGGILINGELYQGKYQMAGHAGHMTLEADQEQLGITGMPGTLENAMGDATVAARSLGKYTTTHALVTAYQQGETFATYVWLNAVRKLALSLCSLSNLLSPEIIVLGGGITKAGNALFDPLQDFMHVYSWKHGGDNPQVRQAHHNEMAGAVGAAAFALKKEKR